MRRPAPLLLFAALLAVLWPMSAAALARRFSAGSLLIPTDPCWQPAQTAPVAAGCAAGGSEESAAGAFGLAYRLQRAGVPVYLAAAAGRGAAAPALVVTGGDAAPLNAFPGGAPLDPPARSRNGVALDRHLVDYWQPPFLVEARALDAEALAILADYPQVRRHRARVPFAAPVARRLTGLPENVVVTGEDAAAAVAVLLERAGLGGRLGLAVDPRASLSAPAGRALARCAPDPQRIPGEGDGCSLPELFDDLCAVPTTTAPQEFVGTAPLLSDGILYAASGEFPGHAGHLRAYDLHGRRPIRLWDAAAKIAAAGSAESPSAVPALPDFHGPATERRLFTDLGREQGHRLVPLHAAAAALLRPRLGVASVAEAAAVINALRGRSGTTPLQPAGSGEQANRLGAISRSTPALVGAGASWLGPRPPVLYVGSETGLLHAIHAGTDSAADDGGRELWGYLPASLLPYLPAQPYADATRPAAIHVDGSPAVADVFVDADGDGRREWRTLLAGSACAQTVGRGTLFALDVTDPQAPRVLWEGSRAIAELGCSSGVTIGGTPLEPRLFLTAATSRRLAANGLPDPVNGFGGVLAAALTLSDGRLLWRSVAAHPAAAASLDGPPTPPALMTAAAIGGVDALLFGDAAGRLRALDAEHGFPLGDGVAWQTPAGVDEPIGGGIAVRGRLALFGTGGAEHAADDGRYAVYAVELRAEGSRLHWSFPLAAGEKVWGTPSFDRYGQVYVGVGAAAEAQTTERGRLVVLDAEGGLAGEAPLAAAPAGNVAIAPGAAVAVSRAGAVDQLGEPLPVPAERGDPARVRILSWRVR